MQRAKESLLVDKEVRDGIILGKISLFQSDVKYLTTGMLCIEYIVWESRSAEFIEFLDNTPVDELPDILQFLG